MFLDPNLLQRVTASISLNLPSENLISDSILVAGKFKTLKNLTSKEIRLATTDNSPVLVYKTGTSLTHAQSLTWAHAVSKLTSTKHKDIILRLAHGELYSRERLARRGLIDDPTCPRCNELETLQHKFFDCPYTAEIWRRTMEITDKLKLTIDPNESLIDRALCTNNPNLAALTVHAEIITRIRQLKAEDANLLLLPKLLVKNSIQNICKKEQNRDTKALLNSILGN